MTLSRPLRLAMVGGGPGAFIGPVHRMAAELDGRIRLVAGAFSRSAERSAEAGRAWGVDPERVHGDYRALIAAESSRADGADLLAVVTPNATHFEIVSAGLAAGLHVMSDKPATLNLAEAKALARNVQASGRLYGLTYVYTGYPMVREARDLVARGDLGAIRKIVVEYEQGWLSKPIENEGNAQAAWRADPALSGVGGCIGDIGVHAFNLAEFVTGLRVERMLADLGAVVPGRRLDDDCNLFLRFQGDVRGVLIASQISAGARNGIEIRVYGEKGGLIWSHERADQLVVNWLEGATEVLHAGSDYLSAPVRHGTRLPTGHPEGFIAAFANLYRDFAEAIATGAPQSTPGIVDGVRGMAFVEQAVAASRDRTGWVDLEAPQ